MGIVDFKTALRTAMDVQGIHDNMQRAGLAAIIGGESNFVPKMESSWRNTDNARIRKFFGSRVAGITDAQLNQIKKDDRQFFNLVYGGAWGKSNLGNTEPDDGYNLRGGGALQHTGREEYQKTGDEIGVDLVNHPELILDPSVAAAAAVAYIKRRFKGGSFDRMKAAVGNSLGEPDAEKNRLFAAFTKTGEWNYDPTTVAAPIKLPDAGEGGDLGEVAKVEIVEPTTGLDPVIVEFQRALHNAEMFLSKQEGEEKYSGVMDFDPGPGFRKAYLAYVTNNGGEL